MGEIKRDARGRLLPGQSLNPSGYTKKFKGLAKMVRAATNDGQDLVDFAVGVLRNESKIYTHSQQWDAHNWLADRGFGKAVSPQVMLEVDSEGAVADRELADRIKSASSDELEQMERDLDALIQRYSGASGVTDAVN